MFLERFNLGKAVNILGILVGSKIIMMMRMELKAEVWGN